MPSEDLKYDPAKPLFLPGGHRYSVDQAGTALERAYASGQPVLLYIHGRAVGIGEPQKSVKKRIYEGLASYGVSVIGFTWDADDGGYDVSRPQASAQDFDAFLDALEGFLSAKGGATGKPAVLAHSMGSLVLSELAKDDRLTAARGSLFSNLVFSAAAVRVKRHHLWLDRIGLAERVYVMVNPKDVVLRYAGILFRPDMLGCELKAPGADPLKVTYVDLAALDVNHRYFVPEGQEGRASLGSFYSQALTGKVVDLGSLADPGSIGGVPVRRLKR